MQTWARPNGHGRRRSLFKPAWELQPVRPDYQVEAPPAAAREGHVDPVRVLDEPGDLVAEDVMLKPAAKGPEVRR